MKREISIALFLLLFAGTDAAAKVVEPDKAFRIASNFVSNREDLRSAFAMQLVYTAVADTDTDTDTELRSAGNPLFYVYNVENDGGFVIVSGDDTTHPVLAYADKGMFQASSMPDNLKRWLSFYEKEISYTIEKAQAPSAEIREEWEALLDGNRKTASTLVLLPTAYWDQTAPYNKLCPIDSDEPTLAGCVATAMGILMRYHQWPEKGTGSNAYITPSKALSVKADFNVTYDWENMPEINNNHWTAGQEDAVATLIYHCGVASYMDYTRDGSGTTTWDAIYALIGNFGYDNGGYMVYRNLYTTSEWYELVRNELNENRPLLYGGVTKKEEGHLFVIDGYNSENFFHVNWGWSGLANGYYLLSSLAPQWQGAGGSSDQEGYAFDQDAIIGLKKKTSNQSFAHHEFYFLEEDVTGEENFTVYGLSTDVDMIRQGEPFKLRFSYIFDYGRRDFNGYMGFFVVDKNGDRKIELERFAYNLKADYVVYDDVGETYTITEEIEKGDKIRMYYNAAYNEQEWKPVRGMGGSILEVPVEVSLQTSDEPVMNILPATVHVSVSDDGSVINIFSTGNNPLKAVRLFDLSGRQAGELNLDNATDVSLSFPFNHIPPGIYILSVQTLHGRSEHKIVKR
ncbi:MAG: thiol protease/hemagglutinin PrtT [Tannerellaceae bacterium]|jgi:hypothetical protein|nr:thiol protease/hemagglutinin PrtT [Tannerellaceae bacterium]